MKVITSPLTLKTINQLKNRSGPYLKLTIDLEKEIIITDIELHADGEKILLKKGSRQENIWGGGINLDQKIIDTTAVLNIRPNLKNNSLELLNPEKRGDFIRIVRKFFKKLWAS